MLDWSALQVHSLLEPRAVLRFACDELERFGSFASAFTLEDGQLVHVCTCTSARIRQEHSNRFGSGEIVFPLTRGLLDGSWDRMRSGDVWIDDDLIPSALSRLPAEPRAVAEWLYWRSGEGALALFPLFDDHVMIGIITVLGGRLREADLPEVARFIKHVSSAWKNARKFANRFPAGAE